MKSVAMLYNEPSPLEVKILSRRFLVCRIRESLDTYLATDGYKAFLKAVADDAASRSSTK